MPRLRRTDPLHSRRSPEQEFAIDPVLVYSTFLGGATPGGGNLTGPSSGAGQVFAQAVTASLVDGSGNLYVGGSTSAADFPTTSGVVQPTNSQNNSVGFLSKINPAGQLIFSTYLQGMQSVASIALDPQDQNIYVAGVSPLVGTPTTPLPIPPSTTPFQSAPRPISIVKLNASATAVLNATYIGGSAVDLVSGLALDPTGNVYVAGYTTSNDFPTMNPIQGSLGTSGHNAFVTKLVPDLGSLVYSTYLGQNNLVVGAGVATPTGTANHGIAVDGTGNAYVILAGASAGCLAKLNVDGSSVAYPNFSCGANAIAVDGSNNLYAAGGGNSGATSGSVAPCPQSPPIPEPPTFQGEGGFVSEFNSAGTLTFSTCLGLLNSANGGPRANGGVNDLVVDSSGNIYVVGSVDGGIGIPLTNAIQGVTSMFVAAIDPRTPSLLFASGIGNGGSADSIPTSIAVDPSGNIYASGSIDNPTTFPVFNALQSVPGMYLQPSNCAICSTNGFVLAIAPTNAPAAALTPGFVAFGFQPVSTTSASQTLTISDLGSAPLTVSNVAVTGDFAIQNGCGTVSAVGGTCTIQVTFTPTAIGTRNGTLTITDNSAGSPHTVRLSGQGAGAAAMVSPTSLSFTTQSPSTTSGSQQVSLTNTGTLDLQVAHIATTGPFSETNLCGATLAAGQGCFINVVFSPTATGSATGTLTVNDSAADSPQTISLTGTGGTPSLGLAVHGSVGSMSTKAGGTVVYTLAIGGAGIGGTSTLSCTGAPAGATCTVAPSPVQISASSVSAVSATVVTTAHSGLLFIPRGSVPWQWRWILAGLGIVILAKVSCYSSLRPRWRFVPLLAMFLCACGGGSGSGGNSGGTPAGSYTLVVTAASGSNSQILNLTLEVQ